MCEPHHGVGWSRLSVCAACQCWDGHDQLAHTRLFHESADTRRDGRRRQKADGRRRQQCRSAAAAQQRVGTCSARASSGLQRTQPVQRPASSVHHVGPKRLLEPWDDDLSTTRAPQAVSPYTPRPSFSPAANRHGHGRGQEGGRAKGVHTRAELESSRWILAGQVTAAAAAP